MKIIIILLGFSISLFGREIAIVNVQGKNFKLSSKQRVVIQTAIEDTLSDRYRLLTEISAKEQASFQRCYDRVCWKKIKKVVQFDQIFHLSILKVGQKYFFKLQRIDGDTLAVEFSRSLLFSQNIENDHFQVLWLFSRRVIQNFIQRGGCG